MANIIKIKPKRTFEWNQDKKFVYAQIPLPSHSSLKNVEIYLSDLILRVTSTQKKQTHLLDLMHQVDYRSPENKFIVADGVLHATLKKIAADLQWSSLVIEDISLADLKLRRRESEARFEQTTNKVQKHKQQLRTEFDRKATQQLMRFEEAERAKLDERKKIQKETAIHEVFSNIDEKTGKINKQGNKKILEPERQESKWLQKLTKQEQVLELEEQRQSQRKRAELLAQKQKNENKFIEEVKKKYQKQKNIIVNNTMFTDEQIDRNEQLVNQVEQFQQIPIRQAKNQKVKFTQKVYPHMAARDTFYKELPMPKTKGGKTGGGDLQSKNPLWLKDKGDSFFKDKNYVSAIEAYSQAIKLDPKLLKAFLNRSISYMKLFKLQEAISDCDQSVALMSTQLAGNQEEENHSRLTLAKIKTRKGICLAWKGELVQSKALITEVSQIDNLDSDIIAQISSCLQHIKAREQSIQSKLKGDQQVRLNNQKAALPHYDRAIEIDQNQYAISNKVLCLNKLKDFVNSSVLAQKGIKKVSSFNISSGAAATKQDKKSSLILLKLYYRRGKALEQLGSIEQAQQNIRKGLTINSEDKDLTQFLKDIQRKQAKLEVKKLKEAAGPLIKQGKITQALQNYGKCLKSLQKNQDVVQYLAILQNQCVCYQKLQKYDDVLSTCIRILKMVDNLQSKVLVFGGKKDAINIDKEDLKKISVRTLLRRANAYIKTNQYYNAKSDLQKAWEISPEEQIKKQLERIRERLKEQLHN